MKRFRNHILYCLAFLASFCFIPVVHADQAPPNVLKVSADSVPAGDITKPDNRLWAVSAHSYYDLRVVVPSGFLGNGSLAGPDSNDIQGVGVWM
ncbi:MAG: hypothetical protein V1913_03275, partial [Fibrobacterota bacterium]